MTPSELTHIGETLYGYSWQTELAKRLNVNDRTVRRWRAGTVAMPELLPREIRDLINVKIAELCALNVA